MEHTNALTHLLRAYRGTVQRNIINNLVLQCHSLSTNVIGRRVWTPLSFWNFYARISANSTIARRYKLNIQFSGCSSISSSLQPTEHTSPVRRKHRQNPCAHSFPRSLSRAEIQLKSIFSLSFPFARISFVFN